MDRSEGKCGFQYSLFKRLFAEGPLGSEECSSALEKLLDIFRRLGFPVAPDKLEGLATRLVFLGFKLDTMAMEVPDPKLQELKKLIQQWLGRRSCAAKELESLIGKLGHAAQVVQPGKILL